MSAPASIPVDTLTALIGERQQYEAWLARLAGQGDAVPAHIVARVRGDYETRLRAVLGRLAEHADDLRSAIHALEQRMTLLDGVIRERTEARLEGELRAAVGEYTEEQWRTVAEGLDGELARLTGERETLAGEAGGLRDIYALAVPAPAPVAGGRPDVEPSSASAAPEPDGSLRADQSDAAPSVVAPPDPEPAELDARAETASAEAPPPSGTSTEAMERASSPAAAPSGAPPAASTGLLGFLRRSQPASGGVDDGAPAPDDAAPAMDPLGALVFPDPADGGMMTDAGRASAVGDAAAGAAEAAGPSDGAKTLRCQECSAMNYPTEWYCERCGGELAAL